MDPLMLREVEAQGVRLPISPETLQAAYPVQNYDDFINWGRAFEPLEGDLDRFRPFLAVHLGRLKAQNVVYTEIMIGSSEIPRDKQELVGSVRDFRDWVDQQEDGAIQVEFLVVFGRNRSPEAVEELADRILMLYEANLIVGVALAGPERGHPVKPSRRAFARFREAGMGIEIHAGEWCGPESVWDALEYGSPDRIGHGIAVFHDPQLVRHCQDHGIHIEMCPTSNVKTGSVRSIEEHPIGLARDLDLSFSVNTDDPGAFECSLGSECGLLARVFGFQERDFTKITENALNARFEPELRGSLSRRREILMTVTQNADRVAGRIHRIENALLPETPLRSQPPEKRRLAERMAYHETPGVSVAVINDGEIEWARGFGVKEAGKPEPVTPETLFQAGSISKPVAAMAALRLVQEGRIDLDEDVNRYLTSWKVPPNGSWQPRVTLRQLLSHTAGLTVHGFPGYLVDRPIPTLPQILDGEAPANTGPVRVNAIPGTQHRYSGGGTTIMQLMLMDLLGQPFPQIMRELVLDPLGMEHSTYEQPLPPARARFAATGHPGDCRPIDGRWHVYPEMAAAGLWTTATDLARFAVEIQQSLAGKSNKVLSTEMVSQMLTPQVEDHMGLGPFLEGKDGSARFGHGGADEGFLCNLAAYKHRGQGSVVMVNSNRGWPVIAEIQRAIALEYGWPDFIPSEPALAEVGPQVAAAYVGEYELKPNVHFTVATGDSGLTLRTTGQPEMPLHAESETTYFARAVETSVTFVKADSGEVRELIFKQNGKEMPAKKVPGARH